MAEAEEVNSGLLMHVARTKTSMTVAQGREGVLFRCFPEGRPDLIKADVVIGWPAVDQLIEKLIEFRDMNKRRRHYVLDAETGIMGLTRGKL